MAVTCADYRLERRLLALRKILNDQELSQEEQMKIMREIAELERSLGMD